MIEAHDLLTSVNRPAIECMSRLLFGKEEQPEDAKTKQNMLSLSLFLVELDLQTVVVDSLQACDLRCQRLCDFIILIVGVLLHEDHAYSSGRPAVNRPVESLCSFADESA